MARMEIVTGRERRRRWSDEKKLQILQEAATSGLSVADVARRHDGAAADLYLAPPIACQGQSHASGHGAPPRFLPVAVVGETEEPEAPQGERAGGGEKAKAVARPGRIEIRCKGGRVLKVEAGLDPAVLRALIRSVEEA